MDQIERGLENLNLKQTNMQLAVQSSSAEDKLQTNDDENDANDDESELTATGTAGENHYYSDDENYFRLVSVSINSQY